MKNKTISLCDKSFEVAQKIHNFSGWIRGQLLKHQPEVKVKVEVNKKPFMNKNAVCKNCGAVGQHWTLECPKLEVIGYE